MVDERAERDYLAACILEPSTLEACGIPPSSLATGDHRVALAAMLTVRASDIPLDTVSLRTELQRLGWGAERSMAYALGLTDHVPPAAASVAARIRTLAEARRIAQEASEGLGYAQALDLDAARERLSSASYGGTTEAEALSARALMEEAATAWHEVSVEVEREAKGEPPRYIPMRLGREPWRGRARPTVRLGPGEMLAVGAATGVGKGHRLTDRVLTPHGWAMVGDLVPGDDVVGADGLPTKIVGVHHRGELEVWRVEFSDGAVVHCDGDHLWSIASDSDLSRGRPRRIVQTRDVAPNQRGWRVPLVEPVAHATALLPVDPYVLGVLLGDGCTVGGVPFVTCPDEHIRHKVASRLAPGSSINDRAHSSACPAWSIVGAGTTRSKESAELLAMGLQGCRSWEKFVPDAYLFADVSQRMDLLHGLMDTDGYACGDNRTATFTTTAVGLREAVTALVRSLGGVATVVEKHKSFTGSDGQKKLGRVSYDVRVCLPAGANPFSLPRKAALVAVRTKVPCRRIKRIVATVEVRGIVCISVAAEDQLYVAEGYVVTHNSSMALTEMLDLDDRGIRCGLVSVEDPAAEWGSKIIGHRGQVNTGGMWSAAGSQEDWQRATRAVVGAASKPDCIRLMHAKSGTIDEVVQCMSRLVRVHRSQVLLVDYLQAITSPASKAMTRRDATDLVIGRLMSAARVLDVPLVLMSQLSRAEKTNRFPEPHLGDLKESGTLENSATSVLMLWIVTDDNADHRYGLVKAKIAKDKRQPRGERWCMRRGHGQVLYEVEAPPESEHMGRRGF